MTDRDFARIPAIWQYDGDIRDVILRIRRKRLLRATAFVVVSGSLVWCAILRIVGVL